MCGSRYKPLEDPCGQGYEPSANCCGDAMNFFFHKVKHILISFAAFVVLTLVLQKTRVSWNVTPCLMARSSGRFEGLSFLIFRFKQSGIKIIEVRTSETSASSRSTTRNMQEDTSSRSLLRGANREREISVRFLHYS